MPLSFFTRISAFHKALHRWYKAHGRKDLPWRNTQDAYRIYLSEIMLQQTQVKTVLEKFYPPFLKKFPTLNALANADKQSVMKAWEGLGYYNRAANLHNAAKQCKGRLPRTPEALLKLPGIGKNTANAIASFAYGVAVPVMEANVRRVLCRVFALETADEKILWQKAELLLDKKNPFDYNQAMMDIGALICRKRNPLCEECPLNTLCQGKSQPELYPEPKTAKSVPVRDRIIIVLRDKAGRYYVKQRDTRFLHGLYGFLELLPEAKHVQLNKRYTILSLPIIGQVTQQYSHFTLQAQIRLLLLSAEEKPEGFTAANLKQLHDLPLSRADQKILVMLEHNEQV